jgi:hypothetical protein
VTPPSRLTCTPRRKKGRSIAPPKLCSSTTTCRTRLSSAPSRHRVRLAGVEEIGA